MNNCSHFDHKVSIHALREEGDVLRVIRDVRNAGVSIHALREEGDPAQIRLFPSLRSFYPRPP